MNPLSVFSLSSFPSNFLHLVGFTKFTFSPYIYIYIYICKCKLVILIFIPVTVVYKCLGDCWSSHCGFEAARYLREKMVYSFLSLYNTLMLLNGVETMHYQLVIWRFILSLIGQVGSRGIHGELFWKIRRKIYDKKMNHCYYHGVSTISVKQKMANQFNHCLFFHFSRLKSRYSYRIINLKSGRRRIMRDFCEFNSIYQAISIMVRVLANGSIPGRVIPKTQKMVFNVTLFNPLHCKVGIKGKVELSREWSSAFTYTSM